MLYRGANILIMDEPTAVLAPQEIEELFHTLKGMTATGASVVFISHKLDEVLQIANRVTVMRRGVVTAAGVPAAGKTKSDLAQLMVGREVLESLDKADVPSGEIVLEMQGVSATSDRGVQCLEGVDLRIRSGQIIGLAGVAGNGQSELAEVITGLRECTGSIEVNGKELANRPVLEAIDAGVAHVPEDRTGTGSRTEPLADRQPHHEVLPDRAHRPWLDHRQQRRPHQGTGAQGRVRGLGTVHRHRGPTALGRQPAAAHPGP